MAMLQEERKDLDGERQKALLDRLVAELNRSEPDLYYRSTIDIALRLERYIADEAGLPEEDRAILMRLNRRDIQVLLSFS